MISEGARQRQNNEPTLTGKGLNLRREICCESQGIIYHALLAEFLKDTDALWPLWSVHAGSKGLEQSSS